MVATQTWKMWAKHLEPARHRARQSWNPVREAGANFAIDLHPAELVKGYAGDAPPLQCHAGSIAVVPGMIVALHAYHLPRAEALADCWSLSGCDLWTVVVDCALRSDVY